MKSIYVRLTDIDTSDGKRRAFRDPDRWYSVDQSEFVKVAGEPIAYWASDVLLSAFNTHHQLSDFADIRQGLATADDDRFLRLWFEVSLRDCSWKAGSTWFPFNKGGPHRRWFGNNDRVINWSENGRAVKNFRFPDGRSRSVIRNETYYGLNGITWSLLSSGPPSFRYYPEGFVMGHKGPGAFPKSDLSLIKLLSLLNSRVTPHLLGIISGTFSYEIGHLAKIPTAPISDERAQVIEMVSLAKAEWDTRETSWGFRRSPLLNDYERTESPVRSDAIIMDFVFPSIAGQQVQLRPAYDKFVYFWTETIHRMAHLEQENDKYFIDLYGLDGELSPTNAIGEIGLFIQEVFFDNNEVHFDAQEIAKQLCSYGVGCIFGRFSLDKDGLILANAGDDLDVYLSQIPEPMLRPDESGILPITDDNDFADDLPSQWRAFLRVAFGDEHYEENLRFLEDGLGKRLRQYFLKGFYDDHVKRYKKRPIYWLITSPRGTLQALIYLHRYNRDTVNRFLNDYLRPYQQKLDAKRVSTEHVLTGGGSSQSEKTKAQKRIDEIRKALEELSTWERDVVRPLAEKRIELDLDDGVKVNYGKLGAILAKVKGLNG